MLARGTQELPENALGGNRHCQCHSSMRFTESISLCAVNGERCVLFQRVFVALRFQHKAPNRS